MCPSVTPFAFICWIASLVHILSASTFKSRIVFQFSTGPSVNKVSLISESWPSESFVKAIENKWMILTYTGNESTRLARTIRKIDKI